MKNPEKIKVMAFGVFDDLHHGHQYFLSEAREHGDELIVTVALDSSVENLKSKTPSQSLSERIRAIKNTHKATCVVPGDIEHGSWKVITTHEPSVIVLGHDQYALREALEAYCARLSFAVKFVIIDKLEL